MKLNTKSETHGDLDEKQNAILNFKKHLDEEAKKCFEKIKATEEEFRKRLSEKSKEIEKRLENSLRREIDNNQESESNKEKSDKNII